MEKHGLRDRDSGNNCPQRGFLLFFFLAASDRAFIVVRLCKRGERVAPAHIIFSLSRTSINIYTNNEVLTGEGESRRQTSRPTAKSMA